MLVPCRAHGRAGELHGHSKGGDTCKRVGAPLARACSEVAVGREGMSGPVQLHQAGHGCWTKYEQIQVELSSRGWHVPCTCAGGCVLLETGCNSLLH